MHNDGRSIPVPRPDAAKGETPARRTGEFPPVKGLDPAPAVARMANNISLYMTSLDMFCRGIPQYVAKMETALRAGDRASLHRLAHTIKGLAATIGAPGIASSAAHCERTIKEEGSVLDETELRSLSGALERLGADVAASGMLDGVDASPLAEQAEDAAVLRKGKRLPDDDNTRPAECFATRKGRPSPPEDAPPGSKTRLASRNFEEASDTLKTAAPR